MPMEVSPGLTKNPPTAPLLTAPPMHDSGPTPLVPGDFRTGRPSGAIMIIRCSVWLVLLAMIACAGCGDDDPVGPPLSAEQAVGAAYFDGGAGDVVLVNLAGTRFCRFDPADGSFSASRPIAELRAGLPLATVGAIVPNAPGQNATGTFYFDAAGSQVVRFDEVTGVFQSVQDVATQLPGIPLVGVSAGFPASAEVVYFFDGTGEGYAVYNPVTGDWTGRRSFATEFQPSLPPFPAAGAGFKLENDDLVIFELSGLHYCIRSRVGLFSEAYDLGDLGNGGLRF